MTTNHTDADATMTTVTPPQGDTRAEERRHAWGALYAYMRADVLYTTIDNIRTTLMSLPEATGNTPPAWFSISAYIEEAAESACYAEGLSRDPHAKRLTEHTLAWLATAMRLGDMPDAGRNAEIDVWGRAPFPLVVAHLNRINAFA